MAPWPGASRSQARSAALTEVTAVSPLRAIGAWCLELVADSGRLWQLTAEALRAILIEPFRGHPVRWRATLEQLIQAGNRSLPLVLLISVSVGMILALQSAYQLREFNGKALVAGLVAVSVTRELAPLLTAVLVAGRVGSAIAAELGTMKVGQEIDALTVMGIGPIPYLVVPRLLALSVALPCLTVFAGFAGILGGCLVGSGLLGIGAQAYLADSLNALQLQDLWGGVLKSLAFAVIIGVVACQQGLDTRGGAEDVGRATTDSVVRSIVLVLIADLWVTLFLYLTQ